MHPQTASDPEEVENSPKKTPAGMPLDLLGVKNSIKKMYEKAKNEQKLTKAG